MAWLFSAAKPSRPRSKWSVARRRVLPVLGYGVEPGTPLASFDARRLSDGLYTLRLVARFHLDNGARLERLNPRGNMAAHGLKQSFGMMVNYLYDLDKVEVHHEKFVGGEVAQSRLLTSLL